MGEFAARRTLLRQVVETQLACTASVQDRPLGADHQFYNVALALLVENSRRGLAPVGGCNDNLSYCVLLFRSRMHSRWQSGGEGSRSPRGWASPQLRRRFVNQLSLHWTGKAGHRLVGTADRASNLAKEGGMRRRTTSLLALLVMLAASAVLTRCGTPTAIGRRGSALPRAARRGPAPD